MISFIVPVLNGLSYTRELVESVRRGNPESAVEWIIVDSGSTDGTAEFCREIGARVVSFRSEPFNYCAAVNAGAAVAGGDVWIVANNDLQFRSEGDLARLEAAFRDWPLLAVLNPGRPAGEADLEFVEGGINGACWAVRPSAFRSWGGMPETMSGYGYDEAFTTLQCWRRGYGLAWLTGWDVLHHGSKTFGPLSANTTAAMRRNLSRLLEAMDAADLDGGGSPELILERLRRQERRQAPLRLRVSPDWKRYLPRQGYINARVLDFTEKVGQEGTAWVLAFNGPQSLAERQWIPWLANELMLQPDARFVGGDGFYAIRYGKGRDPYDLGVKPEHLAQACAVGPKPPRVMPALAPKRATLRERVAQVLHDWRRREVALPKEW